jgi:hypothetical protein
MFQFNDFMFTVLPSSPRLNIVQNHKLLFSFAFYITYNKKIRNIQVRPGCQAVQVLSLLPPVRYGETQPRQPTLPDTPSLPIDLDNLFYFIIEPLLNTDRSFD